MKKKNSYLESIEVFLPQLTRRQGWAEKLDSHSVFLRWEALVGSDMANYCQPLKIVKNVLWVEVENSAWLQQLQFQVIPLLDLLNKSLRLTRFKGLRFCIADNEQSKTKIKEPSLRYVQPPAQDVADFQQQADAISDKDSREALVRFWYLSQACKKE